MQYLHDLDIAKDDDVYPPSEDSILLVESFDVRQGERVLEIGCGSGIVSFSNTESRTVSRTAQRSSRHGTPLGGRTRKQLLNL